MVEEEKRQEPPIPHAPDDSQDKEADKEKLVSPFFILIIVVWISYTSENNFGIDHRFKKYLNTVNAQSEMTLLADIQYDYYKTLNVSRN